MALLNDQPRVATVRAVNAVKVLSLNRTQWHTLLGTALSTMMRDTKIRERQLTQTRKKVQEHGDSADPAAAAGKYSKRRSSSCNYR